MPTKLLVLGATGGTGRAVVEQSLERGYDVAVLVRAPERLGDLATRVEVHTGSADDRERLVEAMRGRDAVISALGVGQTLEPNGLIARCAPAIVDAMRDAGVRRLIFTSAFGVGTTKPSLPLFPRIFSALLLKNIYRDKNEGEAAIRASGLAWTLVHPSMLRDGPKSGNVRAGEQLALSGFPKISRADVAAFLLGQLDDESWLRKSVVISS
jgi:uncharacterized protein YbjT (DUF2867 family)